MKFQSCFTLHFPEDDEHFFLKDISVICISSIKNSLGSEPIFYFGPLFSFFFAEDFIHSEYWPSVWCMTVKYSLMVSEVFFTFFIVSLPFQKLFNFMKYWLSIVGLNSFVNGVLSRMNFPRSISCLCFLLSLLLFPASISDSFESNFYPGW